MKALGRVVLDEHFFLIVLIPNSVTYYLGGVVSRFFSRRCYIPIMKTRCPVSDKMIFRNTTFATNGNHFNNFGRGPPKDYSC